MQKISADEAIQKISRLFVLEKRKLEDGKATAKSSEVNNYHV
jgi:hypothetical protein